MLIPISVRWGSETWGGVVMVEGVAAAVELGAWVGWLVGVVMVAVLVPLAMVVWMGVVRMGYWLLKRDE